MKLRSIVTAAAAASVVAIAGPAAAQDDVDLQRQRQADRAMGLRFETSFNRNFNLVGFGSGNIDAEANVGADRDLPIPSPHGDIKVGYDLPMGLTPLIGIGWVTFSDDTYSDEDEDELDLGLSTSAVVLDVELRWYFKPHRANAMQPFVFGEFNTAFTTFSTDSDAEGFEENDEQNEAIADELNWLAINVGLGMEYKFAQSFAVGGKWGLGFGFTGTAIVEGDDQDFGSNTSQGTMGTSAAIYAAWRL